MYTCQAERGRILNASPYYSDDRATLYGGDALAVLAALPSGSVDAVVCDPPYSSGGMVRGDRAGANTVWVPYAGPVRITITFVTRRPQGHYRTGRFTAVLRDNAPLWHAGTPDIDKALRATFDALTEAGIWRDDKLVAQVTASKVYGVRPGARIHVEPIGGAS